MKRNQTSSPECSDKEEQLNQKVKMKEEINSSNEDALMEARKLNTTKSTLRRSFLGRPPRAPVASKLARARSVGALTEKHSLDDKTNSTYKRSFGWQGSARDGRSSGLLRRPRPFHKSNSLQTSHMHERLHPRQVQPNLSDVSQTNEHRGQKTRPRIKRGLQTKTYSFKTEPGSTKSTSRRGIGILPSFDKLEKSHSKKTIVATSIDDVSDTYSFSNEIELSLESHWNINGNDKKAEQTDKSIPGLHQNSTEGSMSNSTKSLSLNLESESLSALTGDSPFLVWRPATKFESVLVQVRCRSDFTSRKSSSSCFQKIPHEIKITHEESPTDPRYMVSDIYDTMLEDEVEITTSISFAPNLSENTVGSSSLASNQCDNERIECSIEYLRTTQQHEQKIFLGNAKEKESYKASDTYSTNPISSLSIRCEDTSKDSISESNDRLVDEWKYTGSESSTMEKSILSASTITSYQPVFNRNVLTISYDMGTMTVEELAKTLQEELAARKEHNEELSLKISYYPKAGKEITAEATTSSYTKDFVTHGDAVKQNSHHIICGGILDWGAIYELFNFFGITAFSSDDT
jgi:hypothetical protein